MQDKTHVNVFRGALIAAGLSVACGSSGMPTEGGVANGAGSAGSNVATPIGSGTSSGTGVANTGATSGVTSSGSVGTGTGTSTGVSGTGLAASGTITGALSTDSGPGSAIDAEEADGSPSQDGAISDMGVQGDAGTDGDGVIMFPGPYSTPPEAMGLLNGAPAGTLTPPADFASTTVYPGLKFQYTIFVPAQYQKGKPAALMIVLDGREWVTTPAGPGIIAWTDQGNFHADTILANLIHSGDMPVTIVVFIDPGTTTGEYTNQTGTRSMEYDTPNDNYSKFTLTEFLPNAVFPNYDIVQDPDGWCGMGHSSGGIAVFTMAFLNPDSFHKALTFDASFPNTGGVLPAKITTTPLEPIRVHLMSGPNDLAGGWYQTNTQAAMDLAAKGYVYQYIVEQSQHFPTPAGEQNLPDALRWMWRAYTLPWYP